MSILQVQTEDPSFVRDIHSKALLNTDYIALQQHRRERAYFHKQQSDINILKGQAEELTVIREEMLEIKILLKEIISK
jgi:TusA-related sulfurtransferase